MDARQKVAYLIATLSGGMTECLKTSAETIQRDPEPRVPHESTYFCVEMIWPHGTALASAFSHDYVDVRSLACNIRHLPRPYLTPLSATRNLGRGHQFASSFCCFNHKSKFLLCGGCWKFTSPGLLRVRSALHLLTWSGANIILLMTLWAKLGLHLGL